MFLFIPLLLLAALLVFAVLPWRIALPLYLLVLVFSLFSAWRDMRAQSRIPPITGKKGMIGDRAVVVRVESEKAEVEYKGETWKAVSDQPLHPGQEVVILRLEGLILHVAPLLKDRHNESSGSNHTSIAE